MLNPSQASDVSQMLKDEHIFLLISNRKEIAVQVEGAMLEHTLNN
jgi:hypothetical protein